MCSGLRTGQLLYENDPCTVSGLQGGGNTLHMSLKLQCLSLKLWSICGDMAIEKDEWVFYGLGYRLSTIELHEQNKNQL